MVKLIVKKGDENQFLYETTVEISIDELLLGIVSVYNGRLKVQRICSEVEQLAEHGITMPPNMQGLTGDQIEELNLKDDFGEKCQPSGGFLFNKDEIGRRNGIAPIEKMAEVLRKTAKDARDIISKKRVQAEECTTLVEVTQSMQLLKGAVMIVYPMGLPPYDPIRSEFENCEDLSGTQAALDIIEFENASIWWAGKELLKGKKLGDFIGKNEKTKVVCKLQKKGQGAPAREPVLQENEQKAMMAYYYRKQEELKKLSQESDDSFQNSELDDNLHLKRQFQGLNNIEFRTGKKL